MANDMPASFSDGDFISFENGRLPGSTVFGGYVYGDGDNYTLDLVGKDLEKSVGQLQIANNRADSSINITLELYSGKLFQMKLSKGLDEKGAEVRSDLAMFCDEERCVEFSIAGCTEEGCATGVYAIDGQTVDATAFTDQLKGMVTGFQEVNVAIQGAVLFSRIEIGTGGSWLDCIKSCVNDCGAVHNNGNCDTFWWYGPDGGSEACVYLCGSGCHLAHPFSMLGCAAAVLF